MDKTTPEAHQKFEERIAEAGIHPAWTLVVFEKPTYEFLKSFLAEVPEDILTRDGKLELEKTKKHFSVSPSRPGSLVELLGKMSTEALRELGTTALLVAGEREKGVAEYQAYREMFLASPIDEGLEWKNPINGETYTPRAEDVSE